MPKKQVYNPFLPLGVCIPDGEPHVFGDRVYLYGSHDKEGGHTFCMLDYEVYSAPVDDLTDWRCEGVTYRAEQDPAYSQYKYMYAPDVVQGNDGRYYLYYCMSGEYGVGGYRNPISVAVCDTPAGKFEYLGYVRNPDGTPLMDYVCFDPAVMNDNGTIRLYYGTWYAFEEDGDLRENEGKINTMMDMFGRTRQQIIERDDSIMGALGAVLEDDMLTVKVPPKHIIPYRVKGTDFEAHPFFEAASMRKVGEKYYFVYSSTLNHELCYATSDYPDRDFIFGGTVVSNGDIGFGGRAPEEKLNMTGTTHGSIIEINGKWYVFYHRLTHKSDYSRQACAERISIAEDGSIQQVEITSCGLNGGALKAEGEYPAAIACNITNGRMPHGSNSIYGYEFPNVTNLGEERFIDEIEEGTLIGYKYFEFGKAKKIGVTYRMEKGNEVVYAGQKRTDERCAGSISACTIRNPGVPSDEPRLEIRLSETGSAIAEISLANAESWDTFYADVDIPDGVYPLYFVYHGAEKIQIKDIVFA